MPAGVADVVAPQAGAETNARQRLPIGGREERRLIAMDIDRREILVAALQRRAIEIGSRANGGVLPLVRKLEDAAEAVRVDAAVQCAAEVRCEQQRARAVRRSIADIHHRAYRRRSEAVVAERNPSPVALLAIESKCRVRRSAVGGGLGREQRPRLLVILRRQRERKLHAAGGAEALKREIAAAVARF